MIIEAEVSTKINSNRSEAEVSNYDNLLIYRTNISTRKKVKLLETYFENHPLILDWNVDRQDVDNVLRLEVTDNAIEDEILKYIHQRGLLCEELV
jgi:cell fate (sporulation/competence/biofilm development) regulator YmcA (YheA/YmcA/DUF963 family)